VDGEHGFDGRQIWFLTGSQELYGRLARGI
jgi:hypothetical protein